MSLYFRLPDLNEKLSFPCFSTYFFSRTCANSKQKKHSFFFAWHEYLERYNENTMKIHPFYLKSCPLAKPCYYMSGYLIRTKNWLFIIFRHFFFQTMRKFETKKNTVFFSCIVWIFREIQWKYFSNIFFLKNRVIFRIRHSHVGIQSTLAFPRFKILFC